MDGVGVSILPELAVRHDVAAGRLTVLNWADGQLETAVLMIRHKDKWLSPPLAAFMDMVRGKLMEGVAKPQQALLDTLFAPESQKSKGRCC
jgi:DNA-binding transcriptional LysR family regulator